MREDPTPLPTFDEFALFVQNFTGYPARKAIIRETLFEKDMGVTGDDGVELLEATEKQFNLDLSDVRKVFKLEANEYLFGGEGFGLFPLWLVGIGTRYTVRAFTIGELYDAVCQTIKA